MRAYLSTGQRTCHDAAGKEVPCANSGQDAEYKRGVPWPEPRFETRGKGTVLDLLTGLVWTEDANLAGFPVTWQEALDYVKGMNGEGAFGLEGWRLPNRRELRSLMSHQSRRPALAGGHPFENVFQGWYWTSTTSAVNTAYAWYVHMEGARMFYGKKDQFFLLWPVSGGGNGVLPATGQTLCYDSAGNPVPCEGTGQDGEYRTGAPWPSPRFEAAADEAMDSLTELVWLRNADLTGRLVTWAEALQEVRRLNAGSGGPWRLPNINELESLVDASQSAPALPAGHPFGGVREAYWSSTTSMFEPDWAWALYLRKGAVGVGQKWGRHFHVWPVRDAPGAGPDEAENVRAKI
jgi:hypothetical protein